MTEDHISLDPGPGGFLQSLGDLSAGRGKIVGGAHVDVAGLVATQVVQNVVAHVVHRAKR